MCPPDALNRWILPPTILLNSSSKWISYSHRTYPSKGTSQSTVPLKIQCGVVVGNVSKPFFPGRCAAIAQHPLRRCAAVGDVRVFFTVEVVTGNPLEVPRVMLALNEYAVEKGCRWRFPLPVGQGPWGFSLPRGNIMRVV